MCSKLSTHLWQRQTAAEGEDAHSIVLMMPYGNVKVRPRSSLCEAQPKPSSDLLMQHIPLVPGLHLHCLGLRMQLFTYLLHIW